MQDISESAPELNGIKASLDLAAYSLASIKFTGLLWPFKNKIVDLQDKLEQARLFLTKAIPVSELLPSLLGYPKKSAYLFILQNSGELRPTGGFIGTYGILELDSGDISRFDTHDIYHLDMPVKDRLNITPPAPLKKYLGIDKWFMRDANWSPDWPTSAVQIEKFFWQEDKLLYGKNRINNFNSEFDGIIGITPELISSMLKAVGSVIIEDVEYNADNFFDLLEYRVEKGYVKIGLPSWQRKEVIGDIAKALEIKILNLPSAELFNIFNLISEHLSQKNILLYFHDQYLQELAAQQGWTGKIVGTDGDYLMIVDANMASLKTDAVISRNINYRLDQGVNGVFADLKINYAHHGDFDWRTTRYRTYTRVYVPLGSELISADGFSEGEAEIGKELGKTVFSVFLSVEPGQIGSLHFYYKLPDKIKNNYTLYIQKQPGTKASALNIDLSFINSIKSYYPTGFHVYKENNNNINWESDLNADQIFNVKF